MKHTLLIDADPLVVSVASAVQEDIEWGDGVFSMHADLNEASDRMMQQVWAWQKKLEADDSVMCLSDPDRRYFRHDLLPSYKANRTGGPRAMLIGPLKEILEGEFKTYVRPLLEADDICGILATHPTLVPGKRTVVSIDKDLHSVPGQFYRTCRPEEGIHEITLEEADRAHMIQTLTGDATDGYRGCPKVGPVNANRLLEDKAPHEWWPAVLAAFEKAGLDEHEALVQARVARILRHTDYNYTKKEYIPWTPTPDNSPKLTTVESGRSLTPGVSVTPRPVKAVST